jgi:hypothetical protein
LRYEAARQDRHANDEHQDRRSKIALLHQIMAAGNDRRQTHSTTQNQTDKTRKRCPASDQAPQPRHNWAVLYCIERS